MGGVVGPSCWRCCHADDAQVGSKWPGQSVGDGHADDSHGWWKWPDQSVGDGHADHSQYGWWKSPDQSVGDGYADDSQYGGWKWPDQSVGDGYADDSQYGGWKCPDQSVGHAENKPAHACDAQGGWNTQTHAGWHGHHDEAHVGWHGHHDAGWQWPDDSVGEGQYGLQQDDWHDEQWFWECAQSAMDAICQMSGWGNGYNAAPQDSAVQVHPEVMMKVASAKSRVRAKPSTCIA